MDRNSVIGFILIFLLLLAWMYVTTPDPEELERQQAEREAQEDTLTEEVDPDRDELAEEDPDDIGVAEDDEGRPEFGVFDTFTSTDTTETVVKSPRYEITFTTVGGGPSEYRLTRHNNWEGQPVQLIPDTTRSAYALEFISTENYRVDTEHLIFEQLHSEDEIEIEAGEEAELQYALNLEDGSRMIYTYRFHGDQYRMDLDIEFDGVEQYIGGRSYELLWRPGLNQTEHGRTTQGSRFSEAMYTSGYSRAGGVVERFQRDEPGQEEQLISGDIDWVASKNKFFTQMIKPMGSTEGATLTADISGELDDTESILKYSTGIRSRVAQDDQAQFSMFVGPLDYYQLRDFDASGYEMVETTPPFFGWLSWFTDPLVKWIVVPFFNFFGGLVGNVGVVLILFAIAVKLVLYPLTKKSFKSMAAMREIQPEMKEIQEKYKDNPQKQQEATLKLFRKAKVNPLGSCLPMLLQMPILITFFAFFQNSIELRQQSFLWADDLSAPDVIINLPFTVPMLGDHISGFVLIMAVSMVFMMKMSGQSQAAPNPALKAMQYVMPVVLFFVFNSFSSGLSLYYACFNLLSVGQQQLINKTTGSTIDKEELMESVDKKKAKEMKKQRIQEEKQRKKEERRKKAAEEEETG